MSTSIPGNGSNKSAMIIKSDKAPKLENSIYQFDLVITNPIP